MKSFKPLPQEIRSEIARGILNMTDFQVYCWLLALCDWRDYSVRTSARCIAEALGMSSQTVRRSLSRLRNRGWIATAWGRGRRGPYRIQVHTEKGSSSEPEAEAPAHRLEHGRQRDGQRGSEHHPEHHFPDEKQHNSQRHGERGAQHLRGHRGERPSSLDNRSIDNRGGDPSASDSDSKGADPSASDVETASSRLETKRQDAASTMIREYWRKVCPFATNITDEKADAVFLEAHSAGITCRRMHELIDEHKRLSGDKGAAPWRILKEELKKVRTEGGRRASLQGETCRMCRDGAIEYIVTSSDGPDYPRLRCSCKLAEARATRGTRPLAGLPLLDEVFPPSQRKRWGIVARSGYLCVPGRGGDTKGSFSDELVWDEEKNQAVQPALERADTAPKDRRKHG